MANPYLLETPRSQATSKLQISTLISDLARSVALLTADIEREEARMGIRNLSDPAYPVLARSLRTRRENMATIASLEALTRSAPKAA